MAKSSLVPSLTIESVTSVTPRKMTDPRISYNISTVTNQSSEPLNGPKILQNRMHIILYYKKPNSNYKNDCGWHVGGWIKESLGRAMVQSDMPILAGRLRRSDDGSGRLEIESNDSGVRIVETKSALGLVEFLESKEKHEVEGQLVYWQANVDENNFQFCPLFSIQITNFQCGGYSIGISYSLLLTNPFHMEKILHKWVDIHKIMAYEGEIPKIPVFYTPNFKRFDCIPLGITNTTSQGSKISKTILFSTSIDENSNLRDEICKSLVLQCIEVVENKFDSKMTSEFTLITKEPNGNVEVEETCKQDIFGSPKCLRYELHLSSWEILKTNDLAFQRENVPLDVSYWIACQASMGLVLVVISSPNEGKVGMNVYVTCSSDSD